MAMSDPRVRVVVIDDHPFFRDGLRRGLTNSGRVEVVGEAENGREGLEIIAELKPDVAVVDYQMPDLNGLQVLSAVIRDELPTKVLMLSALVEGSIVYAAVEAGAAGYLSKDARRQEIVDAVIAVSRGRTVVPPTRGRSGQPDPDALRTEPSGAEPAGARGAARVRSWALDPGARPGARSSGPARSRRTRSGCTRSSACPTARPRWRKECGRAWSSERLTRPRETGSWCEWVTSRDAAFIGAALRRIQGQEEAPREPHEVRRNPPS